MIFIFCSGCINLSHTTILARGFVGCYDYNLVPLLTSLFACLLARHSPNCRLMGDGGLSSTDYE